MSKKLINGLKYEKQTEEQLYDLSQWELVDIILAYREDLKAKEQECEELKKTLTEIKEIAEENDELLQGYHKEWANNKLILQKISECEE
jgi:hypothetical protein